MKLGIWEDICYLKMKLLFQRDQLKVIYMMY